MDKMASFVVNILQLLFYGSQCRISDVSDIFCALSVDITCTDVSGNCFVKDYVICTLGICQMFLRNLTSVIV